MPDNEWKKEKLGNIFEVQKETFAPSTLRSTNVYHHSLPAWDNHGGPALETAESINSNKTLIDRPCILLSKLNPRKPRVSVVDLINAEEIHCASTEFICLKTDHAEDLRFWGYLLSSSTFSRRLENHAIGSTNSHTRVNPRDPLDWVISIPPIGEQRAITSILETLDTQIRRTEELISKLKKIKQGLLTDLLTRGIDENGDVRPSPQQAPNLYHESSLGLIPKPWCVSDVSQEFAITTGFTLGAHRVPNKNACPYLRVGNVYRDELKLDDISLLEASHSELQSKSLSKDDLLVVEGHANPKEIGRCAMATSEVEGYTFQNHLFRLRSLNMSPQYALLWMNSAYIRSYWRKACATSSGLYTINREALLKAPVALPPKREQEAIHQLIKSYKTRVSSEQAWLTKVRTFRHGLMDDLLTGRVRVTPQFNKAEPTSS